MHLISCLQTDELMAIISNVFVVILFFFLIIALVCIFCYLWGMIAEISSDLTGVFNVQELCFVPEFERLWQASDSSEFAFLVLILYGHPSSPYASIVSKRDRLSVIISDTERRLSKAKLNECGFYRLDIEFFMSDEFAGAADKYNTLLPTSDPVVLMRIYQLEIIRVMQQLKELNLNNAGAIKEMKSLIDIEKAMTSRIAIIQKAVERKYLTDKKVGSPSSLITEIQRMGAAAKRK